MSSSFYHHKFSTLGNVLIYYFLVNHVTEFLSVMANES